jgi:hypothetical protein
MRSLLSFSSGVLFALILANSPRTQAQTSTAEVWKVEIAVFSGVKNPVFTLEPAEVAEVRARLNSAAVVRSVTSDKETVIPARLGYRGMLITGAAARKWLEDTQVSENRILRRLAGTLNDGKAVGLEGYLLSLAVAKGTISPELAQRIKSQSSGAIP